MFNGNRLLDGFLGGQGGAGGNVASGSNLGGIAGGAVAGGLAGLLTGSKTGRKVAKNALTYGGMALLGGVAYKAWSDWRAGKAAEQGPPAPGARFEQPPAGSPFLPADAGAHGAQSLERAVVRAMIAAAKADGHIDATEQQRIFQQVNALSLDTEEKAFVMDELSRPLDVEAVAAGATTPEAAAEIYAASLIAIDPNGPAERAYLSMLAQRLRLDPHLVDHLHAQVEHVIE